MKAFFVSKKISRFFVVIFLFCAIASNDFAPLISKASFSYIAKADQSIDQANTDAKKTVAEWTFFIYMQARNNLAPFAGKNIEAISINKTNPNVNFLVQLDQPKQKGAWRYKIEQNKVVLEDYSDVKDPADQAEKVVDFVRWGAKEFPSRKQCVIFWNHGVGPLNPPYGNPVRMLLNHDHGLVSLDSSKVADFCAQDEEPAELDFDFVSKGIQRGVMFDEDNQTYMTNYDLSRALGKITSAAILGKKIDCLGFDACYMASQEVDAQICDFADYRIGSQELELAHGWNYQKITEAVCSMSHSPSQLANLIVNSFGDLYRGQTNIFTQSAVKLDYTNQVTVELDKVIEAVELVAKEDRNFVLETIRNARKNCQQFTAKVYIDLHSFYQNIFDAVEAKLLLSNQQAAQRIRLRKPPLTNGVLSGALEILKQTLNDGMNSIKRCVFSSTSSNYLAKAKGISIYFPMRGIDSSYNACSFVKNSRWLSFITVFSGR